MKVFIETLLVGCAPVMENGTTCAPTQPASWEALGEFRAADVPEGCHFPFFSLHAPLSLSFFIFPHPLPWLWGIAY